MGKQVDFEKLRKKRQRTQTIKRFIALGVVLVLIGGIITLNSFLIDAGITTQLHDLVESFGGAGYPVAVPGGIIRDVKSMGNNLVVLNDANLYIYNRKGKITNSLQQMSENSAMVATSSRVLAYDVGGKRFSILSPSKSLLQRDYDYNIIGADLNENGDYAVISSSSQYVAQVVVFDKNFNWMFEWFSADNLVVDVSLNAKGNRMAAVCINTRGGQVYSIVYLFDLSVGRELQQLEFIGELGLEVQYLSDGRFSVLTDKEYRVFTAEGTIENQYNFQNREILGIERQGREVLLLFQGVDSGGQELVLLGSTLREQASYAATARVRDMAVDDSRIYLLYDTGVSTYNRAFEERDTLLMRGIAQIHLVKHKLFYLDKEEINTMSG